MRRLRRGVLTRTQLKKMMGLGLLSRKGMRQAKEALAGKHNKTRYIQRR